MIRDLIIAEAKRAGLRPGEFLAERNRPLWSQALANAARASQRPLILDDESSRGENHGDATRGKS